MVMSVEHILEQQRDRLTTQLQESERLRKEAFQACETMRQDLQAVTLERDEWKAGADFQQQQATQLRQQVEALEASFEQVQAWNETLLQQRDELQAQLEAAAVTPAQQLDGTAERLETVRRMIAEIRGWYTCTDWFDEVERSDAWEQVGELLGRLQREAD
jgi:chromosome segregation ATPase